MTAELTEGGRTDVLRCPQRTGDQHCWFLLTILLTRLGSPRLISLLPLGFAFPLQKVYQFELQRSVSLLHAAAPIMHRTAASAALHREETGQNPSDITQLIWFTGTSRAERGGLDGW